VIQAVNEITRIREILLHHGRLAVDVNSLKEDSNLYFAGLTSLATVGVMLALEDQFDIEFPESRLSRKTFESLSSIAGAVADLVH
jgi:acyl carrier protein